ncbi:hypothetical protein [Rhizobium phaseoli]|uniref:hypothetical protein n=1 Tax=Rhizobium phaseoli TaxID=396 RepID=UPI0019D277B1|nr:hypothetical protein [Rhizobium phaseoli]
MSVTILPGGTVDRGGEADVWSFTAVANGQYGIVHIDLPKGTPRNAAAAAAKALLEEDPKQLEGVVSTAVGGQTPTGTSGHDDNGSNDGSDDGDDGDDSGDDGDEDGGDDSGDDGDVDENRGRDDEGDGVGGGGALEERIAKAIARGLISGVIPLPDDRGDGDGSGQMQEGRLAILIAKVTSGELVVPHYDPGDSLGDDVALIDRAKVEALVARAIAIGIPRPDDSGDGDGTGRPIPTLGPGL